MTDDECKAEFRFYENDVYLLGEVLDIPDLIKCPNGVLVDGVEALSVLLKRVFIPLSIWRYGSWIRETSSTIFHDYKLNNGLCI